MCNVISLKDRVALIAFVIPLWVIVSVSISDAQDVPLGARPAAMGEAFVAIGDDGNAAFWNPAGLSLLQNIEIHSMYANLYATGIQHSLLGLAFPFRNWGSFGLAWSRIGFDDFELTYGENQFLFSYALQLPYKVSFGVNTKLLRTDAEYENRSFGDAYGWGFDVGLLFRYFEGFNVGLTLKDMGDTQVEYDTGNSAPVLQQSISFGIAYRLTDRLLLAGGLDDRLHYGGEYWLSDAFALRAGLQDDLESNEPLSWSCGAGFRFKIFQLDYAYVDVPTLPSTHRVSFALRFEQEEPWVRIEWVRLNDLFAAQYKRYVEHPIGSISVVNVSDKTISVRAGIEFNTLTDGPFYSDEAVILGPEESKEIPLFVIFNRNVSSVRVDCTVQGRVSLLSFSEEESRERDMETSQKANVYGRNAIRWDDVRKVAAFIEPKDESVRTVTSRALNILDEDVSFLPLNLLHAIALFDLLGEYGLVYTPDPQTPYSSASRQHEIIDHVQYPLETLIEKRGDCDDFVVLYASCLENIGIPTAILDVPGHLLLAVDVGSGEGDGAPLGFEENAFLSHNGKMWMPVEATLVGSPFHQAWQEGVSAVEQRREELQVVEVDEAWQSYPSNEIDVEAPPVSIEAAGTHLFSRDLDEIRSRKYQNILTGYETFLEADAPACSTYNEIGVHLGRAGLLDEAIDMLQKACRIDGSSSQVFNNLGVAYSKRGLSQEALEAFTRALSLNPDDADVHLNLAFLYFELGDLEQAQREYEEAVKINPDYEGRFEFLETKPDNQKKERQGKPTRGNFIWR
ncbi:MAG: PorV/PorQ family protein [Gemmatimonadota bacterium]|nr:MAG: PorV/PorQ family protein [Gemmatimonadota bacterium]